jgi:valyl-tRNA synthetase
MAWMRNIHDWCISRQLWWGHQIPAWYCPDGHVTVARAEPSACATCSKRELRQDDDVLDTWFSSALWPFSTMGWPERNATLETFYPTSVMETGHDIIFFWVARMMMMGLHFMGDVPFRVVYLHPMVRDEKGQKMSKTKGNVIDPLVITEQFGADALRFTLAALTAQGRDIKLAKERIEGYRAFANKLWNAARFALMNLGDYTVETTSRATPLPPVPEELGGAAGSRVPSSVDLPGAPSSVQLESVEVSSASAADRWILARLQRAVNDAVEALEGFRFNDFADALYQFVWHELCDWYIELAKDALYGGDLVAQARTRAVLTRCLDTSLRLLHPVMPFITEELWQTLRSQVRARWADSIMIAPFPERGALDEAAERSFGPVIGIVEALRNIRGEMNIPFKVPLRDVQLGSLADDSVATVRAEESRIARLANVEGLTIGSAPTRKLPGSAVAVGSGFEVRVPLAGVVDMAAEGARVTKELAKLETDLAGIEKKLANPNFVERAPKEVVEKDRARAEELRLKRTRLEAHRAMLLEAGQASPGEAASTSGQAAIGSERAPAQPDVVVPAATTELQPSPSAAASATVTPTAVAETARQPRPAKKSGVADEKRSKSRRAGAGDGAGKESPVRRAPRTVPGKKSEPGAMKVTGGSQKRSKAAAPKKAPAGQRQRSKAPPSRRNSKRTGSSGTASGSVSRGSETRKVNPRTMRAPSRRASSGTKGGTRGPNAKPRSRRSAPPGRRR